MIDTINHKPQRAITSASWGFPAPFLSHSCKLCMGLPGLLLGFWCAILIHSMEERISDGLRRSNSVIIMYRTKNRPWSVLWMHVINKQ